MLSAQSTASNLLLGLFLARTHQLIDEKKFELTLAVEIQESCVGRGAAMSTPCNRL